MLKRTARKKLKRKYEIPKKCGFLYNYKYLDIVTKTRPRPRGWKFV